MSIRLALITTFIITNFCIGTAQKNRSHFYNKIDNTLLESFVENQSYEYIVLMEHQFQFGEGMTNWSKARKGRYVYESLQKHASETQKSIIRELEKKSTFFKSFYIVNALHVVSDYALMVELASRKDVKYIISNQSFKMIDYIETRPSNLRDGNPEWGLLNIKADSVWRLGITGEGVVIGGQDTGYNWELSPLKSKYRGFINDSTAVHDYNWHDAIHKNSPNFADTLLNPCGYSTQNPCDDNNHGTHTMGTMVGKDSVVTIGVAFDAKWVACRNMDRGWGQPSTYLECFEWFLAPYDFNGNNPEPDLSPHVINNSWYCSAEEGCNETNFYLLENVVNNLVSAGIVVVVSAGNSGSSGCGSISGPPAFFENSFSVGASDISDQIANFSSIGPVTIDGSFRKKPDVSAPGVNVNSVIRNGSIRSFSGTSMAAPHVAGVVALMISANPDLAGRVELIENILKETARPQPTSVICENFSDTTSSYNIVYGYGIINAFEAVKRAKEVNVHSSDIPNNQISIFPNPTTEILSISIEEDNTTIKDISLYDTKGKKCINIERSVNSNFEVLHLTNLPSGVYILILNTNSGVYHRKIIKY